MFIALLMIISENADEQKERERESTKTKLHVDYNVDTIYHFCTA